jgi:hypothetical protein
MNRREMGKIAAAAAFALLSGAAAPVTALAGNDAGVMCAGVNSCKGESECKTATNECKGQNGCAGHGWVTKKSAQECTAAGGRVIK